MWKWLTAFVSTQPSAKRGATTTERTVAHVTGRHALFYKYLNDRYADLVVLTFDEIEDLSGFALPEGARTDLHWWTACSPDAGVAPYADAWRRADRTARANMAAQTVAFERR